MNENRRRRREEQNQSRKSPKSIKSEEIKRVINWESVQSSGRERSSARISQMGVEKEEKKQKQKKERQREGEMVGEVWVFVCDSSLLYCISSKCSTFLSFI